jgi:hypothetical protein
MNIERGTSNHLMKILVSENKVLTQLYAPLEILFTFSV